MHGFNSILNQAGESIIGLKDCKLSDIRNSMEAKNEGAHRVPQVDYYMHCQGTRRKRKKRTRLYN